MKSRLWYRLVFLVMVIILIGATISGCKASGAKSTTSELQPVTLRIGRIQFAAGMTPLTEVMKRDKLIEEAGKELGLNINVIWQDFVGGPAIRQAMASGDLDIGTVGNTPTIIGLSQGEPFHILSLAEGGAKFVLALPPGSPIKTPEDLKGKKVGAQLSADPQFIFNMCLQALFNTMDYQKLGLEVVKINSPTQGAIPPKGLDAGVAPEVTYLMGQVQKLNTGLFNSYGYTEDNYDGPLGKGAGKELPELRKSPYYPEGFCLQRNFFLVTDKMVQTQPKAVVAFLVAQQRALTTLTKMKPEEVAGLAKDSWKLDPAVGKDLWLHDLDYRRGWGWLTEGDLRAVVDQSAMAATNKLIEKPLSWKMVLKNIEPVAPLVKQAYEITKFPEASAFVAKDVKDLRGYPVWEASKWELPKKQQ